MRRYVPQASVVASLDFWTRVEVRGDVRFLRAKSDTIHQGLISVYEGYAIRSTGYSICVSVALHSKQDVTDTSDGLRLGRRCLSTSDDNIYRVVTHTREDRVPRCSLDNGQCS
jgi:hypothetical protein